jgi:hypothetical protein
LLQGIQVTAPADDVTDPAELGIQWGGTSTGCQTKATDNATQRNFELCPTRLARLELRDGVKVLLPKIDVPFYQWIHTAIMGIATPGLEKA